MDESDDAVAAVLGADRLDVSAELLDAVFGPIRSEPFPAATLIEISAAFALRHGLPGRYRGFFRGVPRREPEATVFRMVLDLVGSWLTAGLAASMSSSVDEGVTRIALTLRGGAALDGPEPVAAARRVLAEAGLRPSFR